MRSAGASPGSRRGATTGGGYPLRLTAGGRLDDAQLLLRTDSGRPIWARVWMRPVTIEGQRHLLFAAINGGTEKRSSSTPDLKVVNCGRAVPIGDARADRTASDPHRPARGLKATIDAAVRLFHADLRRYGTSVEVICEDNLDSPRRPQALTAAARQTR